MKVNFKHCRELFIRKFGVYGIGGLWMLFLLFFAFFADAFFYRPLFYMLHGEYIRYFSDGQFFRPFDIVHAGTAMDQPTIGKYLIFYSFFSLCVLSYSGVVRLFSDFGERRQRLAFQIPFYFLIFWSFSFLCMPGILLAHYICDMGLTARRIYAIIYILLTIAVWIFSARTLCRKRNQA